MTEVKKDLWCITDLMYITSKVLFKEEVTEGEALKLWKQGNYVDVLNVEDGDVMECGTNVT